MTKEELAARLNGREYCDEITRDEAQAAKEAGLVVIFGASDDLVEFRGAIYDELGMYGGGEFLLDDRGPLPEERDDDWDDDEMAEYFRRRERAHKVEALQGPGDYFWTFRTDVPHATFEISEDGEPFCRGIVIDVRSLIAVVNVRPAPGEGSAAAEKLTS